MRTAPVLLVSLCLAGASPARAAEPGTTIWRPLRSGLTWLLGSADATPDERCELGEQVVGGQTEPGALDVVVPVRKKAWEAAHGGEEAARPAVRARLAGWPARLLADRASLPRTDDAFVARLARDTWRGLEALTDRENGLPVDHVHLDRAAAGDYTNVTSIGLRLIAIVAARELDLLSTAEAVAHVRRLLDTLERLETHEGFFFNYYDTTSLERTSNFISFVDSSWLAAGLMVVRTALPALHAECSRLLAQEDWRFFYDPELRRMNHGYYVHRGARSRFHYGVLYAESRLGSVIALGTGDVPEAHWFGMVRTFPAACAWQSATPVGRTRRTVHGHAFFGGWYEWGGLRYVPSWGGSMFEALMPTLVLDESRHAPESLGRNDHVHATVQRRFALETLGYPVWGLSPASQPVGDGYGEYGVKPLGTLGYGPGAVTPHASALALAVTPAEAIANLRTLAERFDVYGDFGFYDSVDPRSGTVAHTYLTLDQAMIFIAAANYLKDHCIQRHFAADPIAQRALPILGAERFFD
ncbi:MAG: glucoamylase family protein [Candidatus Binatia bacterium]